MEKHTQLMEYDGRFDAIFTFRTAMDTVAGTVWRLLMDWHGTLVVVPYQSPQSPAKTLHCVPQRIESVLAGPSGMGDFALAVYFVARVNVDGDRRDWEEEIAKATEADLLEWRADQKLASLKQWECDRAEAHKERLKRWKAAGLDDDSIVGKLRDEWLPKRKEIEREVFAPLHDAERMKGVEQDRAKLRNMRAKIESKHRLRIEKEKAKCEVEIEAEALGELGRVLTGLGRKPSKAKLKTLFDFIREEVCHGNCVDPVIRDAHLRRIAKKVEELTGAKDLAERIFLTYSPRMTNYLDEWSKKTAEAEKITEAEARRRFLERVRYMAEFPDGVFYPIQSVTACVHDERDVELFRLVAPTEAQREQIEAQRVYKSQEVKDRLEQKIGRIRVAKELPQRRLARSKTCMEMFGLTDYEWRKGRNAGLIVPVHGSDGGRAKYDIDELAKKYTCQKNTSEVSALLRGEHRKHNKSSGE